MPSQNIYVDADMLIFYFDRRSDKGRIARETLNKVLDQRSNPEIHVKIPQVSMGEVLLFICKPRRNDDCDPLKMIGFLKKFGNDHPTVNAEILTLSQELITTDRSIKPNDAILVAHALLDQSTKWLLTTDQTLITNFTIKNKMDALGNRFTIDSSFHV
jgi:predicted nucleic acid-binding protein